MAAILAFVTAFLTVCLSSIPWVLGADLCEWEYGRSILINDTLFFMGGNYTFQGGGAQSITEQQLYSLNLSTSFPVNGFLKDTFLHATGSSQTQYVGGGAFFTDSNGTTLYSMAGYPDSSNNGINSLNAYDIQYDSWSGVSPGEAPLNKLNRGQAMFATTESTGLGLSFIAGGMDWIPGMITFNAYDPKNLSWVNSTNNVPYFWGPATEYVRFGNKGMLVSVGGYTSFNNSEQRDMSAVQVYDVDSQQWFEVTATGDIPRTRSSFCSGLSSAPDDSSFQMTVYGGYNGVFGGGNGVGVIDDVYVLTMPAFRWIQITSHANSNVNITNSRRHLCNTYQDRQMIVLGGDQTDGAGNSIGGCNADYPPVKLLDTSTYSWQTTYPIPNKTYEVPAQVYSVIGGGPNGAATLTAPPGGFNATIGNAAASEIFGKRIARSQASLRQEALQNTNGSNTTVVAPTPTPFPAASANHTGAIIGAVIGGLALIIGSTGMFVFLWRRGRAKLQAERNPNWRKAELPGQASPPPWAGKRPGGFKIFEMYGDDAEALEPKELVSDAHGLTSVIHSELEAASEPHGIIEKALPELPTRMDDR